MLFHFFKVLNLPTKPATTRTNTLSIFDREAVVISVTAFMNSTLKIFQIKSDFCANLTCS